MDVVLIGTGAAEPFPDPFCACAPCRAARGAGAGRRAGTAALVDGVLLLDCGPSVVAGHGVDLSGVRHVLLTGTDAECWRPGTLGRAGGPVEVTGPAAAGGRAVRPGDRLAAGPYDVRVLAAGDRLGYDVTGPDGGRLLWLPRTGEPAEATLAATAGAGYDAVFLDETYGDAAPAPGHLGLDGFARTLAALRRVGAVTAGTRVVAVHLGHGNPEPAGLAARLAAWGAAAGADGERLAEVPPARARRPRRTLVLGGARSGKSAYAEHLLAAEPSVTYVATAPERPGDGEWERRVAAHRARRPAEWTTVETGDLAAALRECPGPVLVDCVSLWLSRMLDECGAWRDPAAADAAVAGRLDELVAAWAARAATVVAVSSEVGLGVVPATPAGRRYRDDLGRLNARLAAAADDVWLVTAGLPYRLK